MGKGFPPIDGYSEGTVKLTGSANLLAGIRLFGDLMRSSPQPLEYEFEAKLDLGGIHPSIRISESGTLQLDDG